MDELRLMQPPTLLPDKYTLSLSCSCSCSVFHTFFLSQVCSSCTSRTRTMLSQCDDVSSYFVFTAILFFILSVPQFLYPSLHIFMSLLLCAYVNNIRISISISLTVFLPIIYTHAHTAIFRNVIANTVIIAISLWLFFYHWLFYTHKPLIITSRSQLH